MPRWWIGGDRPPLAFRWIARRVLGERLVDVPLDAVLDDADRHWGALVAGVAKAKTPAGRLNLRMAAYPRRAVTLPAGDRRG